jgi:predicted aconitase
MSMMLTDSEKAMADGTHGDAVAKAMDLLVRYGTALGAERFVETNNVCGTVTASTPFMRDFAMQTPGGLDAVYSEFNLDSRELVRVPKVKAYSSHLQLGFDPHHAKETGVNEQVLEFYQRSEAMASRMGVQMLNTCTPYQVGNVPVRGEHCAWMESSAVVYCNSVLGARTNTEGRESTSAAMLTCRIPDWGLHTDAGRKASVIIQVDAPVQSVQDWGLLGYWLGDQVTDAIPVLSGQLHAANLPRLKHFGAAASSSGGIEMYHIVGLTPEAPSIEVALGHQVPITRFHYTAASRANTLSKINQTAQSDQVDYVMLGCPHYSIEQIWQASQLLEGRKLHGNTALWIWTAKSIKALADRNGYTDIIETAGGKILTDSCSAMSRAVPPGTRVVAVDSMKQAHYLPAILGIEAWFGTTEQCIEAACSGRWREP